MAQDLASRLNADWNGASTIAGVVLHFGNDFKFYCDNDCSDEKPTPPEARYSKYLTWSDCRFSAALYSHSSVPDCSTVGDPWAFKTFGWVFDFSAVKQHIRCSYTADGSTRFRYNHGCGCSDTKKKLCAGGNCSNACQNIDPRTGLSMTSESIEVSSCRCNSTESEVAWEQEACYWAGPVDGEDEIQEMLLQRKKHPLTCGTWQASELVLDSRSLQQALVEDFASLVPAFVVVNGSVLGGVEMNSAAKVQEAMLQFAGAMQYDLSRSILLGIDPHNVELPFFALE